MDRLVQIFSDPDLGTHSVKVGTLSIACASMEAALRVHAKLEAVLASDDVIGASLDDKESK